MNTKAEVVPSNTTPTVRIRKMSALLTDIRDFCKGYLEPQQGGIPIQLLSPSGPALFMRASHLPLPGDSPRALSFLNWSQVAAGKLSVYIQYL